MMVMAFFEEKDSQNFRVGSYLVKREKNKTWWWKGKISLVCKKNREGHHSQKISTSENETARFSGQRIKIHAQVFLTTHLLVL